VFHTILNQWQPFLAVFALLVFWVWESIAPFFSRGDRVKHAARNLIIGLINGVVLAVVFAGSIVVVADATKQQQIGLLHWAGFSGPVLFVTAFLLFDIWMYWWHRLNHGFPFLWRFHRMHHSDPEVDVTTATRFHVGEIAFSSLIRLGLIPLIGIPIEVLIVFDAIQLPIISFHHANIRLTPQLDKRIRYFIVTPFMHKVHHSRMKSETDSNFSSLLSIWDRMFRSYVEKENYHEIEFGLNQFDGGERQSVKGMLLTPLK
jgi:sterol desaturase/sphingolipid hydroxylase (fatty acid hydroxylase superfamily)